MAKSEKKWAFLRGKLKLESLDPSYEEVCAAMRREFAGAFASVVERWNAAEARKAALKEQLSEEDAIITVCERLAYEHMDREQLENCVVAGARLSRTEDVSAKVEDSEAYLAWIRKEMPDYLTVHAARTTSLVKTELEKGAEGVIPPGLDFSLRPIVKRTKA